MGSTIINRTILTPLQVPKSGVYYLIGDLVGGNQTQFLEINNVLGEYEDLVSEYAEVFESISKAIELLDDVSDYRYISNSSC